MNTPEGRALSLEEARMVTWLLQHGETGAERFLPAVASLRVVSRCVCGCASIDFTTDYNGDWAVVADFRIEVPGGPPGGIFLFTIGDRVAGLEVYSFGDPFARLPEPESLVPLPLA